MVQAIEMDGQEFAWTEISGLGIHTMPGVGASQGFLEAGWGLAHVRRYSCYGGTGAATP